MKGTATLVELICDFLYITFNHIIRLRSVYPKEAFKVEKAYEVPINICQHPDVEFYILETIKAIKTLLLKQKTPVIMLNIVNNSKIPIERYVFDMMSFVSQPDEYLLESELKKMNEYFRDILAKLSSSFPVSQNANNFNLQIKTNGCLNEDLSVSNSNNQVSFRCAKENEVLKKNDESFPILTPIKTIKMEKFKVYAESNPHNNQSNE